MDRRIGVGLVLAVSSCVLGCGAAQDEDATGDTYVDPTQGEEEDPSPHVAWSADLPELGVEDIAVDATGGVVLGGRTPLHPWVARYSQSGERTWSWEHSEIGSVNGVATTSNGEVWATGGLSLVDDPSRHRPWVAHLVDGEPIELLMTDPNADAYGTAIATGPGGEVYVAESAETPDETVVTLRRLDAAQPWVQSLNAGWAGGVARLAVTEAGSLIVAGVQGGSDTDTPIRGWVARYGPDGTEEWSNLITGEASVMGSARANSMSLTDTGDIVYTGVLETAAADKQFWLELATPAGEATWTVLEGEPGLEFEWGMDVSASGGVIVASAGFPDWSGIIQYDDAGSEIDRWSSHSLTLDTDGTLQVAALECGVFYASQSPNPRLVKLEAPCAR